MDNLLPLLLIGAGAYLALTAGHKPGSSPEPPPIPGSSPKPPPISSGGNWRPPAAAAPYLAHIAAAGRKHKLPAYLLARVLEQESSYRPDVISGATRSPVGAVGIAQVMPATARDPGFGVAPLADPTDPFASIEFAAAYLAAMYRYTGTWSKALAAYNWGPGYVTRQGLEAAPRETREYVAAITSDVQVA